MMTAGGTQCRSARRHAPSLATVTVAIVALFMPTASVAEDHAPKPVAAAAQHDTSAWATSVSVHSDKTAAEAPSKPEAAPKAKPTTKAAAAAPAPVAKAQAAPQAAAPSGDTKPTPVHAAPEAVKPATAAAPAAPVHATAPPAPAAVAPAVAVPAATAASEPVAMPADVKPKEAGSKTAEKPVHSYCVNINNTALDARYLRQKKFLDDLKEDVKKRTGELESTIATYKEWLKRRDEFVSKAQDSLVAIYGNMKSEAAAKQLSELEEETASSVLAKLDARQSSAIVGEMDAKKAARLMEIIAGAGKFSPESAATPAEHLKQASTEADAPEADLGVQ